MTEKDNQKKTISKLVEDRMLQWKLAGSGLPPHLTDGAEIDYITISRQVGSGGEQIAQILADLMNWQMYDKEILDYMAENMKVHKSVLENVDERMMGWIENWLSPIFTRDASRHMEQLRYYRHLVEVLLVIAQRTRAVIVGRAAAHLLPREKGLHVRITAPFELRCKNYALQKGIDIKEATALVKKADREQKRFVKGLLGKDTFDPIHYDMVFNTEKLSPISAAKLIWRAFDQRIESKQEQITVKAEGKDIARIVEHQMQQWQQTSITRGDSERHAHLAGGGEIDYVTISRELGSGGKEVARMLSDLMQWQLYDKEILDYMSENMNVHKSVLESVDEKTVSWIDNQLVPLLAGKSANRVKQTSYYKHLVEVLLVIAEHSRAVIVGRAAGFVLLREKGLNVRVIAPLELRCQRYATSHSLALEQATSIVSSEEKDKYRFVKNFTGKDINDPKYYDIVCNTEKIFPKSVAKLIWRAFDQRIISDKEEIAATKP